MRFWDNLATMFDLELNGANELPVVVVITSCKIVHSSEPSMSSIVQMPATRLFMNPDINTAYDLRKRYWNMQNKLCVVDFDQISEKYFFFI